MLYGLCHMFSRHSLVYTIGSVWTTLNLTSQTSVQHIQVKCDLHFAFLDGGIIGILLRKPCVPKLISMGNTINNPLPLDLSQKPVCKTNGHTNELGSDELLNSSHGEYDFSFDSVAPSYDTPDVFSTTSPSSTVGASLSTTLTIQSPKSDQSFDSQAPSPRPYYMPRITNLPGPLFESSDNATSDHTYAQNKTAHSSALPEATGDTSQVNNSCDLAKNKDCDVTQQLLDTTPLGVATNTLRHDTTSTDTYVLPDETSVSNNSRYYMRARVVNTTRNNKRPGWKTTKHVNYHESPLSRELNDSDYEPTAKCEKPLDNKRYPSDTHIAMQKIIDENKSANQGIYATQSIIGQAVIENTDEIPALPDATDVSNLSPEKLVATSSPKAKNIEITKDHSDVPEATTSPEGGKQDPLLDKTLQANSVISGNANSPSVASVNPQSSDNEGEKPGTNNDPDNTNTPEKTPKKKRGEFCTQIVGIRRQRDPRAFKCSCCSKRTTTLKELNAHFIQNHRRVKCDMCEEELNTPSSLKKHKYTHCEDKYTCRSCDREFPFESQLRSHHHSHRRGHSYFCVYAGYNKSCRQPGDLNAHAKTHYTSLMTCEHCKYSTHDIRNLKSHMRKHTQVQTFCCKQCDRMFTHTMQLIRHRSKCDGKRTDSTGNDTNDS